MGTTENNRVRIQQAVREIERLVSQKQNNLAMIKARQTLEFMISCLGEQALIVDGDLADSIDQLYEGRWISQTTRNRFHRIRVIGNKAVHEGNDSPYDANEAFQLLAQEVHAFLNAGEARNGGAASQRPPQRQSSQRPPSHASRSAYPQRSSHVNHSGSHRQSNVSRSRRRPKRRGFDPSVLVRPILVLVIILILAFAAYAFLGKKGDKKESTTAATSVPFTTETQETLPPETEPETTTAPKMIYKTTATPKLNVRETPSTDGKVLGTLAPGTVVDYVSTYGDDNTWSIITFEGKQAYVSSQFLSAQPADSDEGEGASQHFESGQGDQAVGSTKATAPVNASATKAKTETTTAAKATTAKPKATTAKPKATTAKPKATTAKPKATTAAKPKETTAAKPAATTAAPQPVPATTPAGAGNDNVPTIPNKPAS